MVCTKSISFWCDVWIKKSIRYSSMLEMRDFYSLEGKIFQEPFPNGPSFKGTVFPSCEMMQETFLAWLDIPSVSFIFQFHYVWRLKEFHIINSSDINYFCFHGITEYPELSGTHRDHWVQLLALHRTPTIPPCAISIYVLEIK